ncbi:MAG TPA: aminotransferase class IV [Symbiobacteriaceae bacterium]|nr:aminotransferase class IV [Symbiobacteriaceae bacterium]
MIYLDLGGMGPGLVRAEAARIPANDRGFLYGDGLFETMLVRGGQIPLLPWHLERLSESAAALGIPFDLAGVQAGIAALVAAAATGDGEFAMRLTLSRGPADQPGYEPSRHARPTLMITCRQYRRPEGPLSAVLAKVATNPQSPVARHKTLSALEKVMARAEAGRAGCDEALLLTPDGHIAEGSYTNLFIVRQGLWLTPPLADGCLPGVMRRRVMELTHAVEWSVTPDDLFRCEQVYLTNALIGCLPMAALDGRGLPWAGAPAGHDRLFAPVTPRRG